MPGVGIGVMIFNKEKQILLIRRNDDPLLADSSMHLEGTWTLPAGKVKSGESLIESAKRKVKEEVNLDVDGLTLVSVADDINEFAHYVTLGFVTTQYVGEIHLGNTLEHIEYGFFSLSDLPVNLCEPSKKIIENYKNKVIYKGEI